MSLMMGDSNHVEKAKLVIIIFMINMITIIILIIMIITIGKVQQVSVVLPLWQLSARGEGGHTPKGLPRPQHQQHYHHKHHHNHHHHNHHQYNHHHHCLPRPQHRYVQ